MLQFRCCCCCIMFKFQIALCDDSSLDHQCISNIVQLGGKPRRDWMLMGSWLLWVPPRILVIRIQSKQWNLVDSLELGTIDKTLFDGFHVVQVAALNFKVEMGDSADLLTEIRAWPCRKEFGTLPGAELWLRNNSNGPWVVSIAYFPIAVSDCGPIPTLSFIIMRLVGERHENTCHREGWGQHATLPNHGPFEKAVAKNNNKVIGEYFLAFSHVLCNVDFVSKAF